MQIPSTSVIGYPTTTDPMHLSSAPRDHMPPTSFPGDSSPVDPFPVNIETLAVQDDKSQSLVVFPATSIKGKTLTDRKRCRCCPQSRRGRIICGASIIAFLVLVICLCYFYIPRVPEFKVLFVQVRPLPVSGDIPLNITQNSKNPTDISIKLPIFMGVSVINSNRYDLTVDTFDLTAYIQPNETALRGSGLPGSLIVSSSNNPATRVGYGIYGSKTFPANFNTTFEIQVLLDYTPDPKLGLLSDPAFGELLQVCGFRGSAPRTMLVKYDVKVNIAFLSRIGVNPVLPNEVDIKCPLPQQKITELINRLGLS